MVLQIRHPRFWDRYFRKGNINNSSSPRRYTEGNDSESSSDDWNHLHDLHWPDLPKILQTTTPWSTDQRGHDNHIQEVAQAMTGDGAERGHRAETGDQFESFGARSSTVLWPRDPAQPREQIQPRLPTAPWLKLNDVANVPSSEKRRFQPLFFDGDLATERNDRQIVQNRGIDGNRKHFSSFQPATEERWCTELSASWIAVDNGSGDRDLDKLFDDAENELRGVFDSTRNCF